MLVRCWETPTDSGSRNFTKQTREVTGKGESLEKNTDMLCKKYKRGATICLLHSEMDWSWIPGTTMSNNSRQGWTIVTSTIKISKTNILEFHLKFSGCYVFDCYICFTTTLNQLLMNFMDARLSCCLLWHTLACQQVRTNPPEDIRQHNIFYITTEVKHFKCKTWGWRYKINKTGIIVRSH